MNTDVVQGNPLSIDNGTFGVGRISKRQQEIIDRLTEALKKSASEENAIEEDTIDENSCSSDSGSGPLTVRTCYYN